MNDKYVPVAQGIERLVAVQKVAGSIPAGHTIVEANFMVPQYFEAYWLHQAVASPLQPKSTNFGWENNLPRIVVNFDKERC